MASSLLLAPNPMMRIWRAYNNAVQRQPLLVNMATSASLWAAGDVLSQKIRQPAASGSGRRSKRGSSASGEGEDGFSRVAVTGCFGGLIFGPLGHAWYAWLDGLVLGLGAVPGSVKFIMAKVLADNMVWTPIYVGMFMAYSSLFISRTGPAGAAKKLQEDFLPTVAAEGLVWLPIMATLFTCVPLSHQLLVVNAMTVADVAFLSWLEEHDVSQLASAVTSALIIQT